MTQGHSESVSVVANEDRWLTAIASLAMGMAFFSLWFWLLPTQRLVVLGFYP